MADYAESTTPASDTKEANPDGTKTPESRAAYWSKEIAAGKKWMQRWHTEARRIENAYLSQPGAEGERSTAGSTRYNMFWSNVQTITAILYGRVPTVSADRTNLDSKDDVARVAALILERIFNVELKSIDDSPHRVYLEAIRDLFIAGMGVSWARYDFATKTVNMPQVLDPYDGTVLANEINAEIVTDEFAPLEYVRWSDFLMSPVKRWDDTRWVARRVTMGEEACKKRFPNANFTDLPRTSKSGSKYSGPDDPARYSSEHTVDVWEIWCDETKEAIWFVEGYDKTLEALPDPLQLTGFFPVKQPLRATSLSSTFIPRPDFIYLKDQYAELDMLAQRMRLLTQAIRVVGVYDKTSTELQRVLSQAAENQMIPVDNWAMFAEKGGIKGIVDWVPFDTVVAALIQLTTRKQEIIKDIYEIYGINDVMRGNSNPNDTATAQRLKSQFGTARIDTRQQVIAWWVTMNTRMRAEIICRHWQPETIIKRSNIMMTPDAPLAQQAVQLLKSDPSEIITRLSVGADAIASPDWALEKQQRAEFLQATSQFIGMCMPLIQSTPGSAPFLIQMLQWAAAGFKNSKQIEGVLDQALASLQADKAKPQPPKPPTPREMKDMASAAESEADAKKKIVEAMELLVLNGFDPAMYSQLQAQPTVFPPKPPQPPGGPPQGGPPGPGGPPQPGGMQQPQPGPRSIPGPTPNMPPPQQLQ